MTALANKVTRSSGFSNEKTIHRVVYDFSVDGGATGALDIFEAGVALMITSFYAVVKTTCTGAGATLKVGVTGDDDSFVKVAEGGVANLTANAVFLPKPELAIVLSEGTPNTETHTVAPRVPARLASGDKILMTIGTAALTAGKIEFVFEVAAA